MVALSSAWLVYSSPASWAQDRQRPTYDFFVPMHAWNGGGLSVEHGWRPCSSRYGTAVCGEPLYLGAARCGGMSSMEPSEMVYNAVAARRLQWDNLLWQVPTLSLTAQAFLFTIALGTDSQRFARTVACTLSLIVTFLSITLMARYRQGEISDAHWLERFETDNNLPVAHGRQFKRQRDTEPLQAGWIGRSIPLLPGFKTWTVGLGLFGVAAVVVMILTWVSPGVFVGGTGPN